MKKGGQESRKEGRQEGGRNSVEILTDSCFNGAFLSSRHACILVVCLSFYLLTFCSLA